MFHLPEGIESRVAEDNSISACPSKGWTTLTMKNLKLLIYTPTMKRRVSAAQVFTLFPDSKGLTTLRLETSAGFGAGVIIGCVVGRTVTLQDAATHKKPESLWPVSITRD